jgi:predicted transcriptional regulator
LLEALVIIEKVKVRKYTPGSQKKVMESLQNLGGSVTRADIASDSELDPNVVSSLLDKLVKSKRVEKVKIDTPNNTYALSDRGLRPDYVYKLINLKDCKPVILNNGRMK